MTLKGERENKEAEERERAEHDAMLQAMQEKSAIRIQAAWRGCVLLWLCGNAVVWKKNIES